MAYKSFIIKNAIEDVANEIENELKSVPFDKGLLILRKKFDALAKRFNTTSVEIGKMYFEYLTKQDKTS